MRLFPYFTYIHPSFDLGMVAPQYHNTLDKNYTGFSNRRIQNPFRNCITGFAAWEGTSNGLEEVFLHLGLQSHQAKSYWTSKPVQP